MDAPKDISRPKEGKLRAFCKLGWANHNYWYVMNHHGRIITSGDLYYCVRVVNRGYV